MLRLRKQNKLKINESLDFIEYCMKEFGIDYLIFFIINFIFK